MVCTNHGMVHNHMHLYVEKKRLFKARKLRNIEKNATDANAAGSKMLTFTCNKTSSLDICSLEPREINNLQLKGP